MTPQQLDLFAEERSSLQQLSDRSLDLWRRATGDRWARRGLSAPLAKAGGVAGFVVMCARHQRRLHPVRLL